MAQLPDLLQEGAVFSGDVTATINSCVNMVRFVDACICLLNTVKRLWVSYLRYGRIKSRLIPRKHRNIEVKYQKKRESADISETMY